jgi:hypothetical protein
MVHIRWIGVLVITVAVVFSPVIAVTAVPVNPTSPTNELITSSADADPGGQARPSHLSGADSPRVQASTDGSLVDIDPAVIVAPGWRRAPVKTGAFESSMSPSDGR